MFKKTKATTETITWTVTAGLKVPGEGKLAAELPRLADGTVMVKPELNLGVSRDTDMGSGHNHQYPTKKSSDYLFKCCQGGI